MHILISPAKKMNIQTDLFACELFPVFLKEAEELMRWMQSLTFSEAQKLWNCNDRIAALLSYEGIQYQYMAPEVFAEKEWQYVQEHLRILSGFYEYLKPTDIYITCVFEERRGDNVIQKGTQAKMARGEMVWYMAEHGIKVPDKIIFF